MKNVAQFDNRDSGHPGGNLKAKVARKGSGSGIDMEAIARAEAALEQLSCEFDGWVGEEVAKLLAARDDARSSDLSDESIVQIYRCAHDLKGEGETLGYPLISRLCSSLCRLLDAVPDKKKVPLTLIDNHVDAVQIVLRDQLKSADDPTSIAVIERLNEVVTDLEQHYTRLEDG